MKGLMQNEELQRQLEVLQEVIQGWETVEEYDRQLEAREERLQQLEAEIAATRDRLRYFVSPCAAAACSDTVGDREEHYS